MSPHLSERRSKNLPFPGAALGMCALLALILTACSYYQNAEAAVAVKPPKDRKAAPDFTVKDSGGKPLRLSDYKGKVVLLDFWATWCGPCKLEIPWFKEFEQSYKDRGFAVVGVSMDEDGWDAVKPYIERMKINYRIALGNDQISDLYGGLDALPTTLLIDRAGKIAAVHIGLAGGGKDGFQDEILHLLDSPRAAQRAPFAAVPALFKGSN